MKPALCASAALLIGLAVSDGAVLTPEQALNRWSIADVEFSPDGSRLVFTATGPATGKSRPRFIWLLDLAGGTPRQLTFSGKDFAPRWSPDGLSIAFLSSRDAAGDRDAQLYLLPMRGGEAQRLLDRAQGVTSFRWSPEGRRIALLMEEAPPETDVKRRRDGDDGRVLDKEDRRPRLWILEVESRTARQVTPRGWQIGQIEWLPDGSRVIASATSRPAADQWTQRLYAVDPARDVSVAGGVGVFHEIAAPRGPIGAFAISPDGKTIAYVGARVDGPEAHDLYLQPVDGGAARNVTADRLDRPVSQPRWIDHRTLSVHVARGFTSALAAVGSDGLPRLAEDLEVNPASYARSPDATLAYVGETVTRAPELYVKKPNARPRAVTTFNQHWASTPVVAPEYIRYKGAGGTEIEAAVLLPAGRAGETRPLVALVHGGPTGRWSDSFEPWGQLLVARGYAVLYPNVRGSTGYGERFVEMNRGDWGGGDFADVIAGVDALIARGIADPNRLGIGGWSYGGYMAAWAVTQTDRFKAAVSGAPVIDMASEFGTETGPQYDEWFYGTPYERLDGFIKSSPITYVKNVKTPTLLLQGEEDTTDPVGQSQQFYRGLKRYGVESELVLYPREPHGLREEKHLVDRLNRVVAWYEKYLKPATPSTAQR